VSLSSKVKVSRIELLSTAFYAVSGVILLVFLFLTGFPPHLAFLGVLSLIVAFGVFTSRKWAPWFNIVLFVGATTFTLYTLFSIGFSNVAVAIEMLAYAALTWISAYSNLLKRKSSVD
jgi:uncharacterized membrane protein (DUF2068 family)